MFTFAPDNRIKEHPARFGTADGEWTAVTGWLEGTFTKPMAIGEGKFIQPTGKAYRTISFSVSLWARPPHSSSTSMSTRPLLGPSPERHLSASRACT